MLLSKRFPEDADAFDRHRETPQMVKAVFADEYAIADTHPIMRWAIDQGLFPYRSGLVLMHAESQAQAAIWQVFVFLVNAGLLDIRALAAPFKSEHKRVCFDSQGYVTDIARVFLLLRCFEVLHGPTNNLFTGGEGNNHPETGSCSGDDSSYSMDWLAVMIVRGGASLRRIVRAIAASRYLGALDYFEVFQWQAFMKHSGYFPPRADPWTIVPSLREQAPAEGDSANYNVVGIWLPHGIRFEAPDWRSQIERFLIRHEDIETAVELMFGHEDPKIQEAELFQSGETLSDSGFGSDSQSDGDPEPETRPGHELDGWHGELCGDYCACNLPCDCKQKSGCRCFCHCDFEPCACNSDCGCGSKFIFDWIAGCFNEDRGIADSGLGEMLLPENF